MVTRGARVHVAGRSPVIDDEAGFDWTLCRVLLAVARRGSIASATAELGMSHPTIRRQLERLETAMGAPLFSRSQSGAVPTPLGATLLVHAQAMERAAGSMLRAAGSGNVAGIVCVAADDLLRAEILPTLLLSLRTGHPELRYEVAQGPVDLMRRDADLALSLVRPSQRRVVTSRIAQSAVGLFASEAWVEANGRPSGRDALVAMQALVGDPRRGGPLLSLGLASGTDAFSVATEDGVQAVAMIVAGLGVGALPVAVARRRGLVRILPELTVVNDVWLSVHPDLLHVPHVRRVLDVFREQVPMLLAGHQDVVAAQRVHGTEHVG